MLNDLDFFPKRKVTKIPEFLRAGISGPNKNLPCVFSLSLAFPSDLYLNLFSLLTYAADINSSPCVYVYIDTYTFGSVHEIAIYRHSLVHISASAFTSALFLVV